MQYVTGFLTFVKAVGLIFLFTYTSVNPVQFYQNQWSYTSCKTGLRLRLSGSMIDHFCVSNNENKDMC